MEDNLIARIKKSRWLSSAAICIAIAIYTFVVYGKDWVGLSGHVQEIDTIKGADIKAGKYVKGEIRATLGYYCETKTTTRGSSSKTRLYLVPLKAENKFIGIEVYQNDFNVFEQLTDSTIDEVKEHAASDQYAFKFQGKLKKCNGKEEGYLKEALSDAGIDYKEISVPYYVEQTTAGIGILFTAIAGFCFILGIVLLVAGIGEVNAMAVKGIPKNDISESELLFSADQEPALAKQEEETLQPEQTNTHSILFEDNDN